MSSVEVIPDRDGITWQVLVTAEVDLSIAPALQQRLAEASRVPGAIVIVDLSGCLYIDSTGISALLNASRRLTRSNGALAVVCPNPTPLRIFEITRTAETLNVATTADAAVALALRWRERLQCPDGNAPTGGGEARSSGVAEHGARSLGS